MGKHPILLSQAVINEADVAAVCRALTSGWVAPVGPELVAFETDMCDFTGASHAVALSSGTAALQLGLLGLGVGPGDEVIVPTLTFGATAFAVVHVGARPVFVDVDAPAWGLDPEVLHDVLVAKRAAGRQVAAIIPVDLFGRPADYDEILPLARRFGVPVLIDAAESLGARYRDHAAGTVGQAGVFSFNGNKIMTTSGGGMLVSNDSNLIEKARFLSTQAREPKPWYEHREIGFNLRLSNILAALGRAQLARLPEMVARRREIREFYYELLADIVGVHVSADPPWGMGNSWLTTVRFDRGRWPEASVKVRERLESAGIESRPIWKPMHQQPVFRDRETHLTGVADRIYAEGLCLPSGVGLSDDDILKVASGIREALGAVSEGPRQ